MSLVERVYSVLVVSASVRFLQSLSGIMPAARFDPVETAGSVSVAQRLLAERSFDLVIINSPLPDDPGIRFAIDVSDLKGTVALLLVRSEQYGEVCVRASHHGVFLLSKPMSVKTMETALLWMSSARERLRKLEKKTGSMEDKMKEIRLVNQAKWVLIRELKMDEPAAHRFIEKQAMDRSMTRGQIAEGIIKTYT